MIGRKDVKVTTLEMTVDKMVMNQCRASKREISQNGSSGWGMESISSLGEEYASDISDQMRADDGIV